MAQPAKNRYGAGPKIAEGAHDTGEGGGAMKKAAAEPKADDKGTKAVEQADEASGAPVSDRAAGTEDVPVAAGAMQNGQHAMERNAMHGQHVHAAMAMHHRQESEHAMRAAGTHAESHDVMSARHHEERKAMHSAHEGEFKKMSARHFAAGGMVGEKLGEGAEAEEVKHVDKGPSVGKEEKKETGEGAKVDKGPSIAKEEKKGPV
jgi:hypothetical protein